MIVGVSGRLGSGKDLVGKIIQWLVWNDRTGKGKAFDPKVEYQIENYFEVKKFADKLKDMVCLLIDCNRLDLEDQDFKNKELGEEWWYWEETSSWDYSYRKLYPYSEYKEPPSIPHCELIKLTPRKLLQLLGTDCIRNLVHPNSWVNALMSEYKATRKVGGMQRIVKMNGYPVDFEYEVEYPNWVITDVRFPNEAEAIKARDGVMIRIDRETKVKETKNTEVNKHISETALDNYKFDFVIENNGTVEDLIEKVRVILIELKIIKNERDKTNLL